MRSSNLGRVYFSALEKNIMAIDKLHSEFVSMVSIASLLNHEWLNTYN